MLLLVGIDPAKIPARQSHIAAKHMDILVRYVGYKAGLDASRQSRPDYDLCKEAPAILGDFIESRLTFKPIDPMDRSLFDGMRRMLALVEGATGYPMTTERMEKKAFICFLKAVLDDICKLKAEYEANAESDPVVGNAPRFAPAPSV